VKQFSDTFDLEEHIRQIREEGERRILANAVLSRCVAMSDEPDDTLVFSHVPSLYHSRYAGFALMHLAKSLAQMRSE
jgi:hypothetical protein